MKTPEEIAKRIVREFHGSESVAFATMVPAIAAALRVEREARDKAEARIGVSGYVLLSDFDDMQARAEKAEAERDEARAYAAEVRLREKAAEDARIHAVDRASRIERETIKRCAAKIMPTNDPSDWTEYAKIRAEAAAAIRAMGEKPTRCPRCDSPSPERHPAVQHGGEVQICPHKWHGDQP